MLFNQMNWGVSDVEIIEIFNRTLSSHFEIPIRSSQGQMLTPQALGYGSKDNSFSMHDMATGLV